MKSQILFKALSLIFICFSTTSCVTIDIVKRHHRGGYYVDISRKQKKFLKTKSQSASHQSYQPKEFDNFICAENHKEQGSIQKDLKSKNLTNQEPSSPIVSGQKIIPKLKDNSHIGRKPVSGLISKAIFNSAIKDKKEKSKSPKPEGTNLNLLSATLAICELIILAIIFLEIFVQDILIIIFPIIAIILGLAALVLGMIGIVKGDPGRGWGILGISIGAITISLLILFFIFIVPMFTRID